MTKVAMWSCFVYKKAHSRENLQVLSILWIAVTIDKFTQFSNSEITNSQDTVYNLKFKISKFSNSHFTFNTVSWLPGLGFFYYMMTRKHYIAYIN